MRAKLLLILCAIFLFGSPSIVRSQTTDSRPDSASQKKPDRIIKERIKNSSSPASLRPTLKAKLDENRKEKVKNRVKRIYQAHENAIKRLSRISERVKTRIEKLKQAGQNTQVADNLLTQAQAEINLALTSLETAKAKLESIAESENPKQALKDARNALQITRSHIKKAHALLIQAVTKIKGLRVGEGKTSPTP